MTLNQSKVWNVISKFRGADNAILCRDVCARTNLTGKCINYIVAQLREQGLPIGSSTKGYFVCQDAQDAALTLSYLHAKDINLRESITALSMSTFMMVTGQGILQEERGAGNT